MKIQGRQKDTVILSDSEDDQRVPDTLEKAAPQAKAVGSSSDAKAGSPGHWPPDASARLQSGFHQVLLEIVTGFAGRVWAM